MQAGSFYIGSRPRLAAVGITWCGFFLLFRFVRIVDALIYQTSFKAALVGAMGASLILTTVSMPLILSAMWATLRFCRR